MKKVRFIIFLLLIPFAIFLSSCNNDIPEEFLLEVDPTSTGYYDPNDPFNDIDYFLLTLWKVDLDGDSVPVLGNLSGGLSTYDVPPIFANERLNKGDVMRLENLEPGYYKMEATVHNNAYQGLENRRNVTVKSNNSITVYDSDGNLTEYIVIEPDVQTIIKFVIKILAT